MTCPENSNKEIYICVYPLTLFKEWAETAQLVQQLTMRWMFRGLNPG